MDETLINITKYLPHRTPMLMVDIILIMDDEKVETIFDIKADNIFIENNFLAESGLIENMAQTCSSVVAKDFFVDANNHHKEDVDVVGFISAIKTVKIHKLPKVGDTIKTIATLVSKFVTNEYSLCLMNCKTFHEDELLLEGEINLFIQENNSKD
ncbi:Predicted 3-hydroxylacyl-ACP dehydratase, HotDog domain [Flavobacterium fluvii]|uniref:Predicted 3-hydroxylacyl-ACP dehydratase, HotDog domain n=1 Tax=Flavobacterium fluvii TaxID=468056 RepID=A0A1M5MYD7_9FLAO|nr:ABC transporter permease [Flavobacterium fluvii]SHG82227.1 Predicted 3-hydroxylacyl-ACP dehydratase, HotDog domain [Flavobacterium fluvii]